MGGYDKKIPFEPMADTVCKQVKLVLLMGVTADKIEAAIRGSQFYQEGAPELVHVSSMEEAVQEARKRAKTGMEEIERNILLLQEDANRLVERSIKAEKTLETLATQFHAVSISAQKLSSRMTKMGEDE